jgi:uncharacterized membrane protein required for colicin V production
MHWLYFVLILVLLLGCFLGARSGFLWQVARIVIFAAAAYACINHHAIASNWLEDTFTGLTPGVTGTLAYVVTFLAVCLAGFLVTYMIERWLEASSLKPVDRLLGAAVGVAKAGLLAGGVLTGVALYASPQTQQTLAESRIAPPLLEGMSVILAAIPEKIKNELTESLEKIKQKAATVATDKARGQTNDER